MEFPWAPMIGVLLAVVMLIVIFRRRSVTPAPAVSAGAPSAMGPPAPGGIIPGWLSAMGRWKLVGWSILVGIVLATTIAALAYVFVETPTLSQIILWTSVIAFIVMVGVGIYGLWIDGNPDILKKLATWLGVVAVIITLVTVIANTMLSEAQREQVLSVFGQIKDATLNRWLNAAATADPLTIPDYSVWADKDVLWPWAAAAIAVLMTVAVMWRVWKGVTGLLAIAIVLVMFGITAYRVNDGISGWVDSMKVSYDESRAERKAIEEAAIRAQFKTPEAATKAEVVCVAQPGWECGLSALHSTLKPYDQSLGHVIETPDVGPYGFRQCFQWRESGGVSAFGLKNGAGAWERFKSGNNYTRVAFTHVSENGPFPFYYRFFERSEDGTCQT